VTSVGIDRTTWEPLVGWDHVRQSIAVILTTELGERVYRRAFGSRVPEMIDRPQNLETVMDFYMAVAEALEFRSEDGFWLGEPRFRLTNIGLEPGADGAVLATVVGDYFPDGHRGDFSGAEGSRSIAVPLTEPF
jgi:uncharacterized protein